MAKERSKRYRERVGQVERERLYSLDEALSVVKAIVNNKFDETLAVNLQLGIRPDQSDQLVRGTVALPHGTGKKVRVLCFCKGEGAKDAEAAEADFVGAEELVQKVLGGWLDFDAVVAHPDMMREVSKLGRVLGPRGLMPTPKTGTVTPDVGRAVRELKAGRVEFKNDKTAGMHVACGKLGFSEASLKENVQTVLRAVRDAKPASSKGEYVKRVSLSLTHGPGISLAISSL